MPYYFEKPISQYLGLKRRLQRNQPTINISGLLGEAQHVLIYLPTKVEEYGAALKSLERLRKLKPKWKITVISKLELVGFIDKRLKVNILPFSAEDINFAGVPRTAIKNLVKATKFDLALDFEPSFDIISIMLIDISGAKVKVCFDNKTKAPFYNFEIRVNPAESLPDKYNAMIKYVAMFAEPSGTCEQSEAATSPK